MNTITTTQRLNAAELVKLITEHASVQISELKSNWVKVMAHGAENLREWKKKGFHVEQTGNEIGYVHASVTNVSTMDMVNCGAAIYAANLGHDGGASLMTTVQIKRVRPDLYIVQNNEFSRFVVADDIETVRDHISNVRRVINTNAALWSAWLLKDGDMIEHEGKKVFKLPNGLSVRMEEEAHQFCNVLHNGESLDFTSPHEFHWWLKRFF